MFKKGILSMGITLVIYLISTLPLKATGDSLQYLLPTDTVFLKTGQFGGKYFEHKIAPKQTLYSLARFYGLSLEELYYYNKGLKESGISIDQPITIPIPNRSIRRYLDSPKDAQNYAPIYYIVQKGETLYNIAKTKFRMPLETIMERNKLASYNLTAGQLLFIGWMNINGVPESQRETLRGPMAQRNAALKKAYLKGKGEKKEYQEKGIAYWEKKGDESGDFYALHRYAPINAIIAVTNPMSNRTVYVKVIGRVSNRTHGSDVKVVLSPLAVNLLGAKDPRFYAKIKYYK